MQQLLQAYYTQCCIEPKQGEKFPIIVLEGLDGCGKTTISEKLSRELDAQLFYHPTESIAHLRTEFEDDPMMRTAYFSLGNYIVSHQLKNSSKPVVMDR